MNREWPLLGRTEELRTVFTAATRGGPDRTPGIVISGSAGVGKTRLAQEAFARCGPRSARRHWIVGTATERGVPLGAFADVASDFGPDPLRRVREVIDGLIGQPHSGEVVVAVDDAHLLDDLSAFAVYQLVTRRLATVILTIRSGEPPPDAIMAIWKDQYLERFELQPFSLTETTQLVEGILGSTVDSFSAQRLWQFTQGNALYLRHLLESEVNCGRMAPHSGVWLWAGRSSLSPTLTKLLKTRISQVPAPVLEVLDTLSVAEPLDADVVSAVTDADALAEAESLGLVSIDSRPPVVRLAHPMLGEVRRAESPRLQRLRGRIAAELARKPSTDPRALVRRAVLTVESDLPPDAELLLAAVPAAMQLLDLGLAETLARHAAAADGGVEAKLAHAMALAWQERATEAEALLADLADQTTGPARAQVAILRAFNFAAIQGLAVSAERELDATPGVTDDESTRAMAVALRALIELVRCRPAAAVDRGTAALAITPINDIAYLLATWAVVTGAGDLGRIDEIEPVAAAGYRFAASSAEASHLRMPLAALQGISYRLGGALAALDATVDRIRRDTIDVPFQQAWHSFLAGMSAMCRGELISAQRSLQETLAHLKGGGGSQVKGFAQSWLATVTAMSGSAADARREFAALTSLNWWEQEGACEWDAEKSIAQAWVFASEGAVSRAISITRDAAAKERERGRPAWAVLLLQTATQFGDPTTADLLAELASRVQGPRAPNAAAHAAALAAGDGDALLEASRRYERFGDRLAGADAAAHAADAYRCAGKHGSALAASATAQRLAAECGGADTPALRTGGPSLSITGRQREIISLAAQGLSNKQIAEHLTMSVRSVQGHLFRACQRLGVNSREQLVAILDGN